MRWQKIKMNLISSILGHHHCSSYHLNFISFLSVCYFVHTNFSFVKIRFKSMALHHEMKLYSTCHWDIFATWRQGLFLSKGEPLTMVRLAEQKREIATFCRRYHVRLLRIKQLEFSFWNILFRKTLIKICQQCSQLPNLLFKVASKLEQMEK